MLLWTFLYLSQEQTLSHHLLEFTLGYILYRTLLNYPQSRISNDNSTLHSSIIPQLYKMVSVKYYLTKVLIYISMMTKEIEHFFISTDHLYFLFYEFPVHSFYYYWFTKYSIYVWIASFLVICSVNIFSQMIGYFHFISFDNCTFILI